MELPQLPACHNGAAARGLLQAHHGAPVRLTEHTAARTTEHLSPDYLCTKCHSKRLTTKTGLPISYVVYRVHTVLIIMHAYMIIGYLNL